MKLFDLATWLAISILILGSAVIFVWFLTDAGKVLRGDGNGRQSGPAPTEPRGDSARRPRSPEQRAGRDSDGWRI